MNVTRSNWNQLLPFIQETLKKADYIAIDFEMTGILASTKLRNSLLDSIQLRYWKSKENVQRFLPIQMGLCGFQIVNETHIIATPFNIYLYPFAGNELLNKQFLFSSSSINFLSTYQYDFNRTFYDGVYFISHENQKLFEEKQQMNILRQEFVQQNRIITPDMKSFVQMNIENIINFFNSPEQSQLIIQIKFTKIKNYMYLIKQIEKIAKNQQYHIIFNSDKIINRTHFTIFKGLNQSNQSINEQIQEIEPDIIGARRLIDQIIEQKTPLLLHNGFIDICHLYDKFLYSLPDKQESFKLDLKRNFNLIYDTKFIINSTNLLFNEIKNDSSLKNCFQTLNKYHNKYPIIELDPDFTEYKLNSQSNAENTDNNSKESYEHEAGYDALMTGYVFFKALTIIQNGTDIKHEQLKIDHNQLKYYSNRFPLGSVKLPFNLNDVTNQYHEKQTQIFYLELINKKLLSNKTIEEYFKLQLGYDGINLYLSYDENYQYFMTFSQQENANKFNQQLIQGSIILNIEGNAIIVSTYQDYKDELKRRLNNELEIKQMPTCLEKPEIK